MVDELTAMFRVCKHIKRDGFRCNSPAMTGMNFCFHHIGGKVASLVRQGATCDASAQLDFDYPADRESIQQNLVLVALALREGKIDNQTANTYTRIFRLCEQNLHRWEKKQKSAEKTKMPLPQKPNADEAPGGLLKPAVGLSGEQTTASIVIPTEASKASAAEEPALPPASPQNPGGPLKPALGLSGEQSTTANNVIPSQAEEPAVSTPATTTNAGEHHPYP